MLPTFPEDLERAINEIVLSDSKEMCGTLSLVAPRFHAWNKPLAFHTVVIRRRDDWMRRISECFLPNASAIRILVLYLPFENDDGKLQGRLQPEEFLLMRRLLEVARGVLHLAVTWPIWAKLHPQCGALSLKSLYLIWDRPFCKNVLSLNSLKHPEALEDLAVYPPPSHDVVVQHAPNLEGYLPLTRECVNLASLTFVAPYVPNHPMGYAWTSVKTRIAVVVNQPELDEEDEETIEAVREKDGDLYAVCVPEYVQVLREWVAKMEGRKSLLNHRILTQCVV
ncbi:hypothetical protein C8R47DRAFT_1087296 [Mycena vitilis]|nr:hypothetical protein C8R47DRAFT_1087296 [Mycena vitilis]